MPEWATDELDIIIEKYSKFDLTKANLELLRGELSAIGLGDYIPETITRVIKESKTDEET